MAGAPNSRLPERERQRVDMLAKVAIISALCNAPALLPHVLYLGEADSLTAWLGRRGVRVHHRNLSFASALPPSLEGPGHDLFGVGTYAKLDCPLLLDELHRRGELPPTVDPSTLLYADFDTLFAADPTEDLLSLPQPAVLAATDDVLGQVYTLHLEPNRPLHALSTLLTRALGAL